MFQSMVRPYISIHLRFEPTICLFCADLGHNWAECPHQEEGKDLPVNGKTVFLEKGRHSLWVVIFHKKKVKFYWRAKHSQVFFREIPNVDL